MQKVTAAVPAQRLKEQTQSGQAVPLQLASGLPRRILSLQCYIQNTDTKPIITSVLLSVFPYAFRERRKRRKEKDQIIKTGSFSPAEELYLGQNKRLYFYFPFVAFLVKEANWKSLVEILVGKANAFSHSYASVTRYFKSCYLEYC